MNDLLIFIIFGAIAFSAYASGRDATLPFCCFLAFIVLVLLREHRQRVRQDFITQLRSFRHELRNGGTVSVDHLVLRYNTALTTYDLNVGFLVGSVLVPSPYRIYTGDSHYEPILYSLLSLITGWWALPPGGPVSTLALVQRNLTGGDKTTVAQLIDAKLFRQDEDLDAIFAPPESPVVPEQKVADTGERSRSKRALSVRTEQPQAPTLHERITEMHNPTPPGERLRQEFLSRLRRQNSKARLWAEKTKETLKSKRLGGRTSKNNDKNSR